VTDPPLYFTRADGPYFFDADGHSLLDYTLAWGPLILGSNHPSINRAVTEQLSRGYTFGAQHEGEIALAERIASVVPGVEQVVFANSGSEAVQSAIRIARAATGRERIVKYEGHYHGWFNNVLVSYHPKSSHPTTTVPSMGGQPATEYAQTAVLPWNDLTSLTDYLACHGRDVACVVCEPLLANSGCCEPGEGFLRGLVDACRHHGVVSIFDEVITGFRLALGGAREFYGVSPDLSVYGKALGAGFPLAAVGGRAELFDVLRDGRTIHAGTYYGNPICLAAGLAALDELAKPGVFARMHNHGLMIRQTLERLAKSAGKTVSTCGAGSVFGVHFGLEASPRDYADTLRADSGAYTRFRAAMLAHSVQLLPDGRWYVSAVHGEVEQSRVIEALEMSIAE
jgi:glutamate-1-semialdehyde 2,1-aminomutase